MLSVVPRVKMTPSGSALRNDATLFRADSYPSVARALSVWTAR